MSYRGLGQAKIVPGQINFATLPAGRTSLPNLDPLVQAGLPIAPYIEHGSWETGEPSIMRYGLDPYRGIMGLSGGHGGSRRGILGAMSYRGLGQGGGAAEPVKMNFEVVVAGEPRGSYLYEEFVEASDAAAMIHARSGKQSKVVSPAGSENVVADVDTMGKLRVLHGLGQTIGQSVRRLENQNYTVACSHGGRMAAGTGVRVRGMRAAMLAGKSLLRRDPLSTCHIYLAYPAANPGEELVTLRRLPNGEYDVRFNYSLDGGGGLGQVLTDIMCSETTVAQSWRGRVNDTVRAGAQAAILVGAAAGAIGAMIGRPLAGVLAGTVIGWTGNSVWTATHRV